MLFKIKYLKKKTNKQQRATIVLKKCIWCNFICFSRMAYPSSRLKSKIQAECDLERCGCMRRSRKSYKTHKFIFCLSVQFCKSIHIWLFVIPCACQQITRKYHKTHVFVVEMREKGLIRFVLHRKHFMTFSYSLEIKLNFM